MSPLWHHTNQTNIEIGNGRDKCNQAQVSALDNAMPSTILPRLLISWKNVIIVPAKLQQGDDF